MPDDSTFISEDKTFLTTKESHDINYVNEGHADIEKDIKTTAKKAKIYTRTGDAGETVLCGGAKTWKDSIRVEAYGTIDELDSYIGLCIVKNTEEDIQKHLIQVQKDLLSLGANLAYPTNLSQSSIDGESFSAKIPLITDSMIKRLENWIDEYHKELPALKNFIISGGGNEASAILHIARTIARRAERRIVTLKKEEEVSKNVLKYINRLSDYLFTAGRLTSKRIGKKDLKWVPAQDLIIIWIRKVF